MANELPEVAEDCANVIDTGVRPAGRRLTLRVMALALAPGGARDQLPLPIFKSLRLLTSLLSSLALDSCI